MAAQFLLPPEHVLAMRREAAAVRAVRRKRRQWRQRQAMERAYSFRRQMRVAA